MTVEGRARFCAACQSHVHDLSGMTELEAKAFLAGRAGVPTCVRYLADEQGDVLFELAPSGFVPLAGIVRRKRGLTLGALALGVATLVACRQEPVAGMGIVGPDLPRAPEAVPTPAPSDAGAEPVQDARVSNDGHARR